MKLRKYSRWLQGGVVLLMMLAILSVGAVSTTDIPLKKSPPPSSVGPNTDVTRSGVDEYETSTVRLRKLDSLDIEKPKTEISLIMVGDMLMHEPVIASGRQEDDTYNFDHLFTHVRDTVGSADIAIVNQETILGGTELGLSGYPVFNSPYEVGDAEVKAGFNVILQATNHAYDMKKTGILNDIGFWEERHPGIPYLGIHKDREHKENYLYIFEKDGIRIAILNYTYTTNGGRIPEDESYLIDYMDEERVVSDIKRAREQADFVVVCPHWGTEYVMEADSYQKRWGELFLAQGVDLVIGAHPHVIQPIEWIVGEDGRKMLVYYSLGNFVNGTNSTGDDVLERIIGGMAQVTISKNEEGKVEITDYGVAPLVCHLDDRGSYTVYFLADYTDKLAKKNKYSERISNFSVEKCQSVVDKVW